jgi:drug/metabolite transporter (DMT)-like permease
MALGARHIDAASFTCVRLASGAAVLWFLSRSRSDPGLSRREQVATALALFFYAAPFSYAYLRIGAAVGALVLFGVVQFTMMGYGLYRGERPSPLSYCGLALALFGLCWLTLPRASRPDPLGLSLMVLAGVAWGVYSLLGKKSRAPLAANAKSFLLGVPLALLLVIAERRSLSLSPSLGARGLVLAVVSGAVTSGLGYAVWYRALAGLTATRAAIVQLSVPVLAGLGAVLFLGESLTSRLVVSALAILGGIAVFLAAKPRAARS